MDDKHPLWKDLGQALHTFAEGYPSSLPVGEARRQARRSAVVTLLYQAIGCNQEITKLYILRVLESIALFDMKQQRYGLKNIAEGGELGLANRTNEKIKRLQNMLEVRPAAPEDHPKDGGGTSMIRPGQVLLASAPEGEESRRDSWIDIGVQGMMGVLCYDGDWPGLAELRMLRLPPDKPV